MLHRSNIKKRKRYSASRTSSSTFTLGKSNTLHSKSTYFYKHNMMSSKPNYLVPGVCGLAFLFGLNLAINPSVNKIEQVNATDGVVTYGATDGNPTISLETGGAANGTATNVEVGETAYRENTVTVSGHDIDKYALFINTASGDTGELVGRKNPYATVGKVSLGTKGSEITDNTWGYALTTNTNSAAAGGIASSDLYYNPVPSGMGDDRSLGLSWKDVSAREDTFTDTYRLVFAAKIGDNMPADHYEANVYISAVANADFTTVTGVTANGQTIYTMQEMATEFCHAIETDANDITLKDERDGKIYFVSRLQDGNCWMTQNLGYDIPDASDIVKINGINGWATNTTVTYDTAAYYGPGTYYYKPVGGVFTSGCTGDNGLIGCTSEFSTTGTNNHYLVGNYYSWGAATYGSTNNSSSNSSGDANGSICPEGWQLPTLNNNGSFQNLLKNYGWISTSTAPDTMNGSRGIYGEPLYFFASGYIATSKLESAGSVGFYWSASISGKQAYALSFSGGQTRPDNTLSHFFGVPVRCVFITQ